MQAECQISKLPDNFYSNIRKYLEEITDATELERAQHLTWSIINSRLKKIVNLCLTVSTSSNQPFFINNLSFEEKILCDQLLSNIARLRSFSKSSSSVLRIHLTNSAQKGVDQ